MSQLMPKKGYKIVESVDHHAMALGALSALPDRFMFCDFREVTGFKQSTGSEMLLWLVDKEFLLREQTRRGYVYTKRYD